LIALLLFLLDNLDVGVALQEVNVQRSAEKGFAKASMGQGFFLQMR
jgi:hypothetical protein